MEPAEKSLLKDPACLSVLALALVLRLWDAAATSLWLDDFHSLHHARNVGAGIFWSELLRDNHPPLSFLVLAAVRAAFGEGEVVLALPAVLAGVAGTWVSLSLPGERRAGVLTGLLVACSTLHLEASANLRMYSWLALAAAGLLLGTIRLLESGRGGLVVFVSALLGLHSHYQFVHALLLCGAVSLGLAVTVPRYRSRLVPLAVLLGASLVLALPWLLFGLRVQLGHELAPGGTVVTPARAMQGYLHLLFHGVGDHGRAWRLVYLAGASLAGALALAGCLRLVRSGPPAPAALLIAGGLGLPLWIAVAALVSSRSGYDWRYLVGATPPFAALVALGATDTRCCARARTLTGGAAALVLLSLALATARHPGHEDYRSATRQVLSELRDGDAVLAVDWQPRFFPHGMGFAYYAARAGDITEIPRLEHTADYRLAGSAGQHERVSCLLRSVPSNAPFLATLRAEFSSEHSRPFGRGLHLVTFSRD